MIRGGDNSRELATNSPNLYLAESGLSSRKGGPSDNIQKEIHQSGMMDYEFQLQEQRERLKLEKANSIQQERSRVIHMSAEEKRKHALEFREDLDRQVEAKKNVQKQLKAIETHDDKHTISRDRELLQGAERVNYIRHAQEVKYGVENEMIAANKSATDFLKQQQEAALERQGNDGQFFEKFGSYSR